jgi:hypothetical protein
MLEKEWSMSAESQFETIHVEGLTRKRWIRNNEARVKVEPKEPGRLDKVVGVVEQSRKQSLNERP